LLSAPSPTGHFVERGRPGSRIDSPSVGTESKEARVKVMLITGATGTVGGHLVGRFHGRYRILAQGRDAVGLAGLRARHPGIETVQGDLHSPRLAEAVHASQLVIHAAAQRYADIAETHCALTLDANVLATHRLADRATRSGVERFLFVSTVEAGRPSSIHAMSKYLAERIVLELSEEGYDARFHVCRLGRISASQGRRPPESEAHPDSTRFVYTVEEAGDLIEFALLEADNGDILIPKMRTWSGPTSARGTHETVALTGEIETGHETDLCFILNRHARHKLAVSRMDSSRVDPPRSSRQVESAQPRAAA
jgi:FlaA1/EpsC-like NDP-sugar epimerase